MLVMQQRHVNTMAVVQHGGGPNTRYRHIQEGIQKRIHAWLRKVSSVIMGATFPPPLNSSFFLRIAIVVGYALELKEAAMQPVTAVSFGRWLKERRKLLDLTQDQLARKVGCALITIKKLEADERRPSRQIAERLLEVLAIPEDDQVAFLRLARGMRRDDQVASRGETPLLPANAFPLSGSDHRSIRGYGSARTDRIGQFRRRVPGLPAGCGP